MSQQAPRAGFTDVDREADPRFYVRCLDAQHASAFKQRYKRRTFDLLDLRPGQRVLDVGCGTGVLLPAFARLVSPGGHVVGIDYAEPLLRQARDRVEAAGIAELVTLQVADAHRLPFPDARFDAAHVERVLMHLDDPDAALRELREAHWG